MKPTKEQIEAYREQAGASPNDMKSMIAANLKETCDKYAGHEDRLEDCIKYLTEVAREILNGKNGEVNNETCYRICRDYFNEEVWKAEDEEKTRREKEAAERKAKSEKRSKAVQGKKYPKQETITASVDDVEDDDDDEELDERYNLTTKPKAESGQLDLFALMGA